MPRPRSRESKAQAMRDFLLRPESKGFTAAEVARKFGTSTQYVYNVRRDMRWSGATIPKAESNRRLTRTHAPQRGEAEAVGSSVSGGTFPQLTSPRLRWVYVRRSNPEPAPQEAGWRCGACRFEGSGDAPAACPKCKVQFEV